MTAKESKAVACTCADHVAGETGYVTFSAAVPYDTELTLLSALHAAEAELGELRRRVVALADDWDARNRLDQSYAQWMREKTYEQCADELRLLASDGGADGAYAIDLFPQSVSSEYVRSHGQDGDRWVRLGVVEAALASKADGETK